MNINYWIKKIIIYINNHSWLSILNYIIIYFQNYQNIFSNTWFNIDLELIANHFIILLHLKIINNSEFFYKISSKKSNNLFHLNIYQNWNHSKKRWLIKKRSEIEYIYLYIYYTCYKNVANNLSLIATGENPRGHGLPDRFAGKILS